MKTRKITEEENKSGYTSFSAACEAAEGMALRICRVCKRPGRGSIRAGCWLGIALTLYPLVSSAQQATVPPPPPAPTGRPDLPPIPPPPASARTSFQPRFSVVIDAAHGGADTGARLTPSLPEKDLTLSLSIHLRSALSSRGIEVTTIREADSPISFADRAGIANRARASACIVLHATASGTGVHLFTSSLAPTGPPASHLVPWETAQSSFISQSLRLTSEINSALGQAGIPVTLGRTSLQPLDNLSCPAVAIEIAPLLASSNQAAVVSDSGYQKRILDAITAALIEWREDWKQQP